MIHIAKTNIKTFTVLITMLISFLCLNINLNAQHIEFSFTANHTCEYAELDSVFIENISMGCDTTIYWNDTVISFIFTGLDPAQHLQENSFIVQSAPNPFEAETEINVYAVSPDNYVIQIYDITGRELASSNIYLTKGMHKFRFFAGNSLNYIVSIKSSNYQQCIHLLQSSSSQSNTLSLVYDGYECIPETKKFQKSGESNFTYIIGNELKFNGFVDGDYEEIIDTPMESTNYIFNIGSTTPESPMPGELIAGLDNIVWNWSAVEGASGYKWSLSDNYETANDIETNTTLTMDGWYCGTEYTIFVWAYNPCGNSEVVLLTQETSFSCGCTFSDNRDSNIYPTVQIGSQCWMAKNLAYLPFVHSDAEFQSLGAMIQRAYGVYGYNGSDVEIAKTHDNYSVYGVLYNWWAAMDGYVGSSTNPSGLQGVCPKGWHIPSDDEWKQLEGEVDATYPYGDPEWDLQWFRGDDAGSALAGNAPLWADDNLVNHSSFNSSGLNILPGGQRDQWGNSIAMGGHTYLWSATEDSQPSSWVRAIYYDDPSVYRNPVNKQWGFSVRCVRD